jgi:hypothetical protein
MVRFVVRGARNAVAGLNLMRVTDLHFLRLTAIKGIDNVCR